MGRLREKTRSQYLVRFSVIDYCLFGAVNIIAALYAPILDCDEVFNYWEPTHYLNHGFGLQTWEYSPEYAIRSWLYIVLHAIPGTIISFFFAKGPHQFYAIRILLGLVCAYGQTRLYSIVSKEIGPGVARIFEVIMLSSTGIFYASVAFLPSSFAMYTTMMGMEAFMDWQTGLKTHVGIMWFGIGAIVGWPFSAALILPLGFEELVYMQLTGITDSLFRLLNGLVRIFIVAVCCFYLPDGQQADIPQAVDIPVNVFFYHRLVFVPWRIVSYNIFSGSSKGPEIFGTEPWHFYIRNLLLNFNIWFLLALCAGPIVVCQFLCRSHSTTRMSLLRSLMFATPFYLWLAVFSLQAHKEERFMYPAYPFLCLNAAMSAHNILFYLGHTSPQSLLGKVPAKIKLLGMTGIAILAMIAGILRTAGTVSAYHAPMAIYKPLHSPELAGVEASVCLGKEWYRFPSSYFLPQGMRGRFVKSAFDGLLPGQFSEASIGFGLFPTWLVPPGMNDLNIEDPGKYVDISHCSFLVDSSFPHDAVSAVEPDYIGDKDHWDQVACSKFLDGSSTSTLARLIWIPDWDIIPARFRRKWGQYCLLRQKPRQV